MTEVVASQGKHNSTFQGRFEPLPIALLAVCLVVNAMQPVEVLANDQPPSSLSQLDHETSNKQAKEASKAVEEKVTHSSVKSEPTVTFAPARPLTSAGVPIVLSKHAAPRLVDWNNDGVLDLLVACGDGSVWLFLQGSGKNRTDFLPGAPLAAAGENVQLGNGFSGACFADLNGDGKNDLVVCGADHCPRYYANTGKPESPKLKSPVVVRAARGRFVLPETVQGRFDIADWDQDGLLDLITGDYDGRLTWYRNTGSKTLPAFGATGVVFRRNGVAIHEPYNVHPRVFDFNLDGLPDLSYGMNWGFVKMQVNPGEPGVTNFPREIFLKDVNGAQLNIRELIQDDTIPEFADLTGDGVVDLVSGGMNGKLLFMEGVSYRQLLDQIEVMMTSHQSDLATFLRDNAAFREKLIGLHHGLRNLTYLPLQDRQVIRDWYRDHIARFPQYLRKQELDTAIDACLPYLAAQVWINLFESMPDSASHRRETAASCGFSGLHVELLVDLGLFYIENSRSSVRSQQALYDLAKAIPPELQIVEVVTQDDFLRPPKGRSLRIESRAGVNLFAQVGESSEGFPADATPTLIDGFCVVVAHELNHNIEHAAGRIYPWFWQRKFELLEQAAPPDVVFRDRKKAGLGFDLNATQARFRAKGLWDGNSANWTETYQRYWTSGGGAGFERHWLRDNLSFCIENPQEAFATLANQYFNSSRTMLELAEKRWRQGDPSGLNQVLFFAEVYSLGKSETIFYRIDTAAYVDHKRIPIERDEYGHIRSLLLPDVRYDFTLDEQGNVLDCRTSQAKSPD
ncbi:FG-GAP repeat domain-containing protein [Planctomicrobium piriforme]|uniref:Repeat domain-containing protein n=1 Tax=Planctomicrobium piriforme TaxID=1576369 RepID=A0A1I3SEN1_9PLAN|nr:VCBS repeat-containing protein [Planctomicrobium piriforme]SFJ57284.1 Repeat domain-containing protein [Planctomicrobium piriforme]